MAKAAAQAQAKAKNQPRLKKVYDETIRKALQEQFKYDNEMEVPRLDKIVLNMGVGEATGDSKKPSVAAEDLALIAGQKPSSPAPASRSPASRCARRCRSAPR